MTKTEQLPEIMRPKSVEELIGNESIKKILLGEFASGRISHTYLLSGQYGAGKTTIARIIADKLDAQIFEHDAGAKSDIETMRELVSSAYSTSIFSDKKVYILDEFHKVSKDAQNAFLKVTENPPKGVYFIFCTSEPGKIIAPLVSRCIKLEVEPVTVDGIREAVRRVQKKFNITVENRQDWLKVVDQSEGSLRVVYNNIQRLMSAGEKTSDGIHISSAVFDMVLKPSSDVDEGSDLIKSITSGSLKGALAAISAANKEGKKPYETTLGAYRYLKFSVSNPKIRPIVTDLAYILATREMANTWEGLEWVLLKNL